MLVVQCTQQRLCKHEQSAFCRSQLELSEACSGFGEIAEPLAGGGGTRLWNPPVQRAEWPPAADARRLTASCAPPRSRLPWRPSPPARLPPQPRAHPAMSMSSLTWRLLERSSSLNPWMETCTSPSTIACLGCELRSANPARRSDVSSAMLPHLGSGGALRRGACAALHIVLPGRHHGHGVEPVHLREPVPRRMPRDQGELATDGHAL